MLKGIYSAAAGMTSQMVATDVIADNLANVSTPGYKGATVQFTAFGQLLVDRIANGEQVELGDFSQGSAVMATHLNFAQGDLIQTGNPLDVALEGDGFFAIKIQPNDTVAYTRAGHFTRDNDGNLVTPDGGRVQGGNGDITIPPNVKKIMIGKNGDIVADNVVIDRLTIAQFEDNQALKRIGNNLYTTMGRPTGNAENVSVEQGALERSNANVITELVNSITGLRVYEVLQKSIQMQNETLSKSVNDVGSVT